MDVKGSKKRKKSGELYEILSKYLNIVQVYLYGKGYSVCNTGSNMAKHLTTLTESVNKRTLLNEHVGECLQDVFQDILHYLDTPRDKQVMKGILAELTSVRFTAKLQGIQSRQGTTNAKKKLKPNLERYKVLCRTSQTVRNNLTTKQQYQLTRRIIAARKAKEIRIIAEG